MTPKICGIASLLSLMFSFTASGQETHRLTIPELVSRHGPEPISLGRVRELLPEDFDELVSTSDLIIEGRIERSVTYLSDDQRDLFTDYFLSPQRVVIGSGIVASSVPGEVAPIVVKRWGGETMIGGVRVIAEDDNFRPFRTGEYLILMLTHNKTDGKYRITGEIAGVFSITAGHVQPIVRHPKYERFEGIAVDQLESEIRRQRQ